MSVKRTVLRAVGRGVLYVLIMVVRMLPLGAALALGRALGRTTRRLSRKRYGVALKNLRIAYGNELTAAERERIARASFEHFGMFAVECIKFAFMTREEVSRRVTVEGYDGLCELLSDGRGCILVSGHLGNFEIAARVVTDRGHELYALARDTRDRGTTDLMRGMRERMGIRVVAISQSLKQALSALRRNALLAVICDQNASDIFVPFFGQPTGTVDGPARIALKMRTPMAFFYCVRDGRGHYVARLHATCRPESSGDDSADVHGLMTIVNTRLEEMIRRNPEQWLWFHDRWRSSPGVCDSDA